MNRRGKHSQDPDDLHDLCEDSLAQMAVNVPALAIPIFLVEACEALSIELFVAFRYGP